jgi:hypothetical protein
LSAYFPRQYYNDVPLSRLDLSGDRIRVARKDGSLIRDINVRLLNNLSVDNTDLERRLHLILDANPEPGEIIRVHVYSRSPLHYTVGTFHGEPPRGKWWDDP